MPTNGFWSRKQQEEITHSNRARSRRHSLNAKYFTHKCIKGSADLNIKGSNPWPRRGKFPSIGERGFIHLSRFYLANITTRSNSWFHETYLELPTCGHGMKQFACGLTWQQRFCFTWTFWIKKIEKCGRWRGQTYWDKYRKAKKKKKMIKRN